jgi:hypothetical protein
MVDRVRVGDYFLCYLTQVSRFVGVLEATGQPYVDNSGSVWHGEDFPCRIGVKVIAQLPMDTAVPIRELADRLSIFQGMKNPNAWTGAVRGSPSRWKDADGEAVTKAILDAQNNPIVRPIETAKLRRPKVLKTQMGLVTVPDTDDEISDEPTEAIERIGLAKEERAHTEIQWRLLRLGSGMGLHVWVARNDRSSEYQGHRLADIANLRNELPRQFDEATTKTIELIDVLWLKGNAIVAAFEIESTTQIYSGLLRMSDLLAMQPNITIPLYLVAPDERRPKVMSEVNRPTFSRLQPPLRNLCRYLPFSVVRDQLPQDERIVRNLDPKFLEDFSESWALDSR